MTLASDERAAICDEFLAAGSGRPTLCAGWDTRDQLAHLLVRERQPWVAPGMVIAALSPMVDRARAGYASMPWPEMVEQLRVGPPSWSPFRVGEVDEFGNGAEYFVHHEDIRRGVPGWEPRPADPSRDAQLWTLLRSMGRLLYRGSRSAWCGDARPVTSTWCGPGRAWWRWAGRDRAARVRTGGRAGRAGGPAGRRRRAGRGSAERLRRCHRVGVTSPEPRRGRRPRHDYYYRPRSSMRSPRIAGQRRGE